MKNLWNNKKANQYIKSYSKKKIIKQRAKARGINEIHYLKNNLLQKEVTAKDVAESFFAQLLLDKTTANIITVDGGNIEASLR